MTKMELKNLIKQVIEESKFIKESNDFDDDEDEAEEDEHSVEEYLAFVIDDFMSYIDEYDPASRVGETYDPTDNVMTAIDEFYEIVSNDQIKELYTKGRL